MSAREVTQFSITEMKAFDAAKREPANARERYMTQCVVAMASKEPAEYAKFGGLDNIQRVRVIEDGPATTRFDFVLKLPLHILEQKKREAERERRRQEVIAKAAELRNDPKKLKEFVERVVAGILGRATAALYLAELTAGRDGKKAAQVRAKVDRDRGPRKPLSKDDIWKRAQSQDRRNRIEASKEAAEEYRRAHPKPKKTAPAEAR